MKALEGRKALVTGAAHGDYVTGQQINVNCGVYM
jgi:hypothetical protein